MIDEMTQAIVTALTDLVLKAMLVSAGVIGVGLSIFAGKLLITTIKNFFTAVAGGGDSDSSGGGFYDERDDLYFDSYDDYLQWYKENYEYDLDDF